MSTSRSLTEVMYGGSLVPPYYTISREERNLVALLYHLLLDRHRLRDFLVWVLGRPEPDAGTVADAELYVEFAMVRDLWDGCKPNGNVTAADCNRRKADFIRGFAQGVYPVPEATEDRSWIEAFNACFGAKSTKHIESPGNWVLGRTLECFKGVLEPVPGPSKEAMRRVMLDLILLKWAFNAKPDLVIFLPPNDWICIEAKLCSGIDQYPSDKKAFSAFFVGLEAPGLEWSERNAGTAFVWQTFVQEFLFERVLGIPKENFHAFELKDCDGREPAREKTWAETFQVLGCGDGFCARYLTGNRELSGTEAASPV